MRLTIKDLTLRHQRQIILGNLSHSFGPSLNLIWGENGSGKTTFLRLLSDPSLKLTQIRLEGIKKISFMPLSTMGLHPDFRGQDILSLWCKLKQTELVKNEISDSDLFKRCLDMKTSEYSNGMRQIFKYYLHTFWNPELLLLDEPVSFLDKNNKELLFADLNARRDQSIVFFTNQEEISGIKTDFSVRLNPHV